MSDRRWRLSAESVTAASAVVAALIALAVGVWENAQERRHNRLSVFPSLEYVAELQTENEDSVGRGVVRVVNEGVGPAVIDRLSIRVRGPDGAMREYSTWAEASRALERWGVEVTSRTEISEGTVMGVGRARDLVAFSFDAASSSREAARIFTDLLEQLHVSIVYHSIYGDPHRAELRRD